MTAPPRVVGPYKFVELSVVTDDTLEECVNEWVAQGWHLDRIHFVTTDASRRPGMAFVGFVRGPGVVDAPARAPAPELAAPQAESTAPLGLAARLAADAAAAEDGDGADLVAPSTLRGQRRAANPTVPGRRRGATLPGRAGERGGGKR